MAFLNFLPNKSAEFFSNKFLSSSKSKDSGETFASRLLRRSESPQKEAFPTSEITWRTNSTTTAGSKPVWCSFAARAASHNCVRGPIGSKIRAARFNCLLSMLGLNEMPLRLKYFFINLSTFFGRKSAWWGTGASFARFFLSDFDRPRKAAETVKSSTCGEIETPFSSVRKDWLDFSRSKSLLDEDELDSSSELEVSLVSELGELE